MAFMRRIKLVLGVATVMAAMLAASAAPAMASDFDFSGDDLRGGDGVNRIVSSHNVDFGGLGSDGVDFGDFLAFGELDGFELGDFAQESDTGEIEQSFTS